MAVVLLQALERTELNKLPKGIQNKLEKFVTELQNANEALKTQHERFKADSEQQYFDIEKRLAESQEQILCGTKELQTLKEESRKLNEELCALKGIEGDNNENKPPQQQTKAKYEIEAEKRELARVLEKKTQEVENLTEDLKRLNEKLAETNKVKVELQLKLDKIQSSAVSVQHREKRMEQEKELLEKKNEWLTVELKKKTEELLRSEREKGKEILELKASLKSSTEKVSTLESQLTTLKQTGESQTKRAEDLNSKLKQAKDERNTMEEKFRNELNAHVKLSSLYKGAASDLEIKNQELNRAVEELSKVVKDTSGANKVLEKKAFESEEQKKQVEAELKEKIKKMEKELENATVKASAKHCCVPLMSEEQLDSMCPSAAAIAAIVKPGMKFFDLYNAYAECLTQLQLEKQETKRVSRVLDEIVHEVESKAPVLKRQREEYESMQRSMASLCNKLEQARTEIYRLQKEKEEAKQQCDNTQREKLKIERQLEDTSTQLCALLVELEAARGSQVSKGDGSSADISSTSEDARSSQLTFRSVSELQTQNQSLLARLRELEDEKDKEKTLATSARVTELESSVSKLQKEVELLREQRNQQKQLADSSARQRDMYKALLTQSTGFSLPTQGQDTSPQPDRPSAPATRSTPQRAAAAEAAQTAQTKAALKQLNDSFTLYKKEKAENDRMLNETNERLQKQLTELRSSHAKLSSQLEFSSKRYEILQETVSAYHREISALQERNHKMVATTQRHEHIIHTMSHDLRQTTEKLALEEARVENLTKERDMLRQAESRLSKEKDAILVEQRNQNLLLTNLKSIQLSMERTETETRQRLNSRIGQLEAELVSMKTRLEKEVAQRHALGRSMDAQLLEAKKQLETQNTLQQKTRELLRGSEQQVAALKAQLASGSESTAQSSNSAPVTRAVGLRAPLRVHSPVPAASQQSAPSEQEVSELKNLLRSAEEQSSEFAEQLKCANSTVEQYRSVVLSLEENLKKEKELRSPLEVRLKEAEEVQKQLETRVLELEKMKERQQEEKRKAVEAVEKQVCELQRSLKASQTEQQEALERAAFAVTQEQRATQDSLLQTKLAAEAQAKYVRELMLHAADVEVLQQLKKTHQQEVTRNKELEEELKKTSALLQEKTAASNTLEKQLKENLANLSQRCEELGKQNSLLHQQMDDMAAKSRQQQQQQQQQQQLDISFSEEGKTTEQILEILKFVRREKDIALAQCEAHEGEALRYKQRVEHQDRELKELLESLNAEREKIQATTKTLAQQQEQLKRMESVGALQEANKMLKMDRDKLQQELLQAQAKVTKLQSDIDPLHTSLSVLSEKNGSLQADKRLLEEDLRRSKARVQQLMSQQKNGDAEEKQKLTSEREAQLKRIAQLVEETVKLKTELTRSNANSNSANSQIQALKDSVNHLTTERDALKKDLEAKNSDILERNKTITQVKKIGRRYKTQYEELKVQHDKLVSESTTKAGSEAAPNQEVQQELSKTQEEFKKMQEERNSLKEELQKKQEETQKSQQELEESQKENQLTKKKLQELQNQLTQLQSQLSQAQTQIQQNQNQLTQTQKELQQAKNQTQQAQNQFKSAQSQALIRQRELQQTKEALQQSIAKHKELQQTSQEVNNLKSALSQTENKVTELQNQLETVKKTVTEREEDIKRLQEQLNETKQAQEANQASQTSQSQSSNSVQADPSAAGDANLPLNNELEKLKQELSESKSREEQLKHQMAEKEEKTKKAILGAKVKINQVNGAREKLSQEVEELKQTKEELEVRMNALKSQFEGRIHRLERELKESQSLSESREEPQDQNGSKVSDHSRPTEQRQISLKSPAQDRGSSSLPEPPTANIRPTPSTSSPSSKPSPSTGSKATPRASIRPMVTPATVTTPTPTATVMPTTQAESQESVMSVVASVHSTSSGLMSTPTSMTQPTSSQATAFVQPTQQQAANQEAGSSMEAERPSTSSSMSGAAPSKRVREEEEDGESSRPEISYAPPITKKLRLKQTTALQVEGDEDEEQRNEGGQDSPDENLDLQAEDFPVLAEEMEEETVSQSILSDQGSQSSAVIRDVIVIDTDSESRGSKEGGQKQEVEGEEEENPDEEQEEDQDEDDEDVTQSQSREDEEGNDESREADDDEDTSAGGAPSEESECGVSSGSQISELSHGGERVALESESPREPAHPPQSSTVPHASPSSSLISRLHHMRRPQHGLLPQLNIQPPAPELGPPHSQRQYSQSRRTSAGRGPQLTPGIGAMPFFDEDDRMVPSTPTLVVPHRTDGFAEAIHSPQVSHLPISFRFGAPEDLLPQTSASNSDLGQLASHGGLGMYESPLFLAAHDEDGGGRSVPTTPLQVAAPMTVFTESLPSDTGDNMASQSVPMVTASTGIVASADEGDEVFMEQEGDGAAIESSLETQTDMESARQSDESLLPSTSQDPDTSNATQRQTVMTPSLMSRPSGPGGRRMFLSRTGGRGGATGRGGMPQ